MSKTSNKKVYRLKKSKAGYAVLCNGRRVAQKRTFNDAAARALILKYHAQQRGEA